MGGASGGRTGSGNGGQTGGGQGGFIGGGQGGFVGGGQGGFVGGGQGGFVGGGQGGSITGGAGSIVSGCPRSVPLIDDFDEPNRGGPPTGGYFNVNCGVGSWYVYGDGTAGATVTPPAGTPFTSSMPGNGGTGYAAHVNGSAFADFGFGFGVNINTTSMTAVMPYNATGYSGISFSIMGTATSTDGANMLRVSIPTPSTSSLGSGGTCVPAAGAYCDGHWGKVIPITGAWTKVTILFSELTKDPTAAGAPFSSSTIIGVHWQAGAKAATATTPAVVAAMNVWVDDLAFVP
ncbi:MAG TPA: hypothetical protein VFH68_09130 [Polyangia bacterium]|nr:hypothetical protein [Polyangia bacterium]